MACTNSGRSNLCLQPQSRLAALSSNTIGQPSARMRETEIAAFSYVGLKHFCVSNSDDQTYGLSDRIHFVGDLEVRQNFLYLLGEFMWGEAHGVDVVGTADQCFHWGLQDLQSGPVTVI